MFGHCRIVSFRVVCRSEVNVLCPFDFAICKLAICIVVGDFQLLQNSEVFACIDWVGSHLETKVRGFGVMGKERLYGAIRHGIFFVHDLFMKN